MRRWRNFMTLVIASQATLTPWRAQKAPNQSAKESAAHEEAMKSFEAVLRTDPHNAEARVGEVKSAIAAALEAKRAGDNDGAMVIWCGRVNMFPMIRSCSSISGCRPMECIFIRTRRKR